MHQEKNILHTMFVLVHQLKCDFQKFVALYGLTEMEAKFLFYIGSGTTKVSELIHYFQKHKSTIRQKTKSLESKGYIVFTLSQEDKRERIITLTEKGKKFYQTIKQQEQKYYNHVFEKFSQRDRETFARLLEKITIEHHYENIC